MNKFLMMIIIVAFLSCKLTPSINKQKIQNPTEIIYDTLVFNENMKGENLKEKFESSQSELNYYKTFINSKKINKLKTIKEEYSKSEIIYLGEIKDLNNKDSYQVIIDFTIIGIGSMESPRGKSNVIFINENQDKIIIYNLPMPEDLPKYIEKNVLFFNFEKTKVGISILGGLPPELCLPEIGCH
jgi:hypothetical protein